MVVAVEDELDFEILDSDDVAGPMDYSVSVVAYYLHC